MDPTRLTVELWNVLRPEVANSHHFDEDPDSYLQVCNQLKGGSGSVSKWKSGPALKWRGFAILIKTRQKSGITSKDFTQQKNADRMYTVIFLMSQPNAPQVATVLRIRDVYPGSWLLPIPHPPDPKTATKERSENKFVVLPFL
jgi:hypothetical protein